MEYLGRGVPTSFDDELVQDNVPSAVECILFCKEKSKEFNVAKHYGGEWQIKSNYFFWNTQEGEGSRENPVD